MDLKELVSRWLKDEFPNWEITKPQVIVNGEAVYFIRFKPLHREQIWLYADRVELDNVSSRRRPKHSIVVYAHDTRFFRLLWNRLHVMELGFQKAMASRDFHRPESK